MPPGNLWESGERTLLRLSRRSAYSSSTSCSRGLQAGAWLEGGGGSAMFFQRLGFMILHWRSVASFEAALVAYWRDALQNVCIYL